MEMISIGTVLVVLGLSFWLIRLLAYLNRN